MEQDRAQELWKKAEQQDKKRKEYPSGITVDELCLKMGVHRSTLWRLEQKPARHWLVGKLNQYLELTGCDESDLD